MTSETPKPEFQFSNLEFFLGCAQFMKPLVAAIIDSFKAPIKQVKKQLIKWEKQALIQANRLPVLLDFIQMGLGVKSRGLVVIFMEPKGAEDAVFKVSSTVNAKPVAKLLLQGGESAVRAACIKEFRGARAPALTSSPSSGLPGHIAAFLVECCGEVDSGDTRKAIMALLGTLIPNPPTLSPRQCGRCNYLNFGSSFF